jgi:hypothetical protein
LVVHVELFEVVQLNDISVMYEYGYINLPNEDGNVGILLVVVLAVVVVGVCSAVVVDGGSAGAEVVDDCIMTKTKTNGNERCFPPSLITHHFQYGF